MNIAPSSKSNSANPVIPAALGPCWVPTTRAEIEALVAHLKAAKGEPLAS